MTSTNRDLQPDWEALPEELLSLSLSFLLPYQRSLHACLLVNSTFHRVASLFLVRFDLSSSNFCSTCRATKQRSCLSPTRLKSPGCNWNCVVAMHCSQPFRGSGQWFFVKPLGNQVGVGITCDPSVAGIRFHESLCGVYLDARSYHHGKDEDQARNNSGGVFNSSIAALIYQGEVVPNKPNLSLGVAVDLEKNEAWFTFPRSTTFFRRPLPEHFRGKALYACAQAWAGCAAHISVCN